MDFNKYQELAERTANKSEKDSDNFRFANFGMGISGEAGEVTDLLKKVVFHGHNLDREKLAKELGDVLWYLATIATTANLSLEMIAEKNIEKLKQRYPEGFSETRSINRQAEGN
ncbi:nucleoside triphosphate pyrophosphohydrolase family protein [Aneurinibacillus sp. Ricciae_BoGa-3]|uniref:nucleoside triphosphate pyrophosphohydrolase family protein n=1 Tax=Aneurinibacillus sp. Ricciae_BoGa-3 TaxID=3022697 RepID=UPI002341349A|nr:nucleoside triphosphate pyrophosphohydrolase family protein [Aneurinibacillus sp. Ricciae_BoGa-3]WCK56740.1 nucleoside triphosphate pyrophosphohydrolase family protein [Aneurinibacillus sp. Ricciae_BoGa-3]